MKNILFSLFLLHLAFNLSAQRPVLKERFYPNGQKMYEGYFINDKPVGKLTRYHENGKIRAIQNFLSNDSVQVELFAGDGSPVAKGLYIGNKKEGVWEYFAKTSKLLMIEHYKGGLKQGQALVFADNGEIIDKMNYKNDLLEGERIQYYPSGYMLAKYHYKEGKLNGSFVSLYETGQKDEEGFYKDNKKHGIWKIYKEDGTTNAIDFENGRAKNQDELDKRLQEQMDLNEKGNPTIKDPQDYIDNPDVYFKLIR